MAKRKPRPVVMPKKDDMIIVISSDEVRRKVRKPMPPPCRVHRSKKTYRRRQKHPRRYQEE